MGFPLSRAKIYRQSTRSRLPSLAQSSRSSSPARQRQRREAASHLLALVDLCRRLDMHAAGRAAVVVEFILQLGFQRSSEVGGVAQRSSAPTSRHAGLRGSRPLLQIISHRIPQMSAIPAVRCGRSHVGREAVSFGARLIDPASPAMHVWKCVRGHRRPSSLRRGLLFQRSGRRDAAENNFTEQLTT